MVALQFGQDLLINDSSAFAARMALLAASSANRPVGTDKCSVAILAAPAANNIGAVLACMLHGVTVVTVVTARPSGDSKFEILTTSVRRWFLAINHLVTTNEVLE